MKRPAAICSLVCTLMMAVLPSGASAQDYPARPVRVLVPWPAGGIVDLAARTVGERLQSSLGQTFITDNRAGAGGVTGADVVAKAAPDGHTLVFTTSALNMNAALGGKLPFDVTQDFEPVAVVAYAPGILVVHPGLGVRTTQELIALAKARPGKLSYASAGNGSPAHLSAELFKSMLGLDILHVPYKGAPPAMIDQIAGRVDVQFANPAVALPQIKAGKLVALAVTSTRRFGPLPEVPTMAEAGVPNFEADQWLAYLAPRATPRPVVERLVREINKALAMDDVRGTLAQGGMTAAAPATPAEFAAYLKKDLAKWTAVVKTANIQPD
jgi:tripartite-type tricarboxylate transporter receptor subunit TctC